MDDVKQQVVDRLKQANNILVTVRTNPSIDLLSACIGLALLLDKLDKHAAAVFSGEVPSAMEFLKPDETIEQTPNSLRDFIIALDKSKADKLRYKVEDKVVRIFITPYKTSLSQDDLEFSQGDFNIDVVVALGVHEQTELDAAITAHGRILHDATVVTINNTPNGNLGSLNWQNISASSVSEMVASMADELGDHVLDEQIATALLTGVVAETARFSNDKTTPQTMRIAGELMAAGANQQLVANELQEKPLTSLADNKGESHDAPVGDAPHDDAGTLEIAHAEDETSNQPEEQSPEPETPEAAEPVIPAVEVGDDGALKLPSVHEAEAEPEPEIVHDREMLPLPEPGAAGTAPSDALLGGTFEEAKSPANNAFLVDRAEPKPDEAAPKAELPKQTETTEAAEPSAPVAPNPFATAPLSQPVEPTSDEPIHTDNVSSDQHVPTDNLAPLDQPAMPSPAEPSALPAEADRNQQTLEEIEAEVHSPHSVEEPSPTTTETPAQASIEDARSAVMQALSLSPQAPQPTAALNAQYFGDPLHQEPVLPPDPATVAPQPVTPSSAPAQPATSMAIHVDGQGNLQPAAPASEQEPSSLEPLTLPTPQQSFPGQQNMQPPSDNSGPQLPPPPPGPPPIMPPFSHFGQ